MYSKKIDKKWQEKWEKNQTYKYNKNAEGKKIYVLEMFSYPSASKLHLGHWYNYGLTDAYARLRRMQGYNVFHPMGFDAFGLPAENFAIKTGVHPKESTKQNIENMEIQLKEMGGSFDWSYEIKTNEPEYYKWTQWLFTYLYKRGLAYKKEALVNFCPSCNTVLANEQVIAGECERCSSIVQRKKLNQWFFKITDYAEELLQGLEGLDWPELTKKIQQNWIGKSTGAEIEFKIKDSDLKITAYTTRPDTLCGVKFVSVAPESELAQKLIKEEKKEEAEKYISEALKKSDIERQFTDREKTCAYTGSYAINPITKEEVPVLIADYVLESYGTGVVMGVPAHDERDKELAAKYGFEEKVVINEKGILVESGEFNGLKAEQAKLKIVEKLEQIGEGKRAVKYKLKDWLVSRQRYWGSPIPVVYCDKCGEVVLEEKDLPVLLPDNVEFKPDGKSPLAKSEEFRNTICPKCGGHAEREVDTLDTFVCSSWYYLRYPYHLEENMPFDKKGVNEYVPVDTYVGGKEHAAMHLIYSRFIYKALRDGGYVNSDEPFTRLIHQGLILGPDGNKMSKSKGNTVAPDEYIEKYGSDTLRMWLMFGYAYEEGGPWNEDGIKAMSKYISRVEKLVERITGNEKIAVRISDEDMMELNYVVNTAIKGIEEDLERFSFNTAIAKLMVYTNEIIRIENKYGNVEILSELIKTFVTLLAPVAPHISEELWEKIGEKGSVHLEKFPKYEEKYLTKSTVKIAVQINGKLKEVVEMDVKISKEEAIEKAKLAEKVAAQIVGKEIVKEIYVPGKIVNIVVR